MTPAPGAKSPTDEQIAAAAQWVQDQFPFKNYLEDWTSSYLYPWLAQTIRRHVSPGASILDFGTGPGDIAAFLARIGYSCVACDDLQDPWHQERDNKRKILEFARLAGVDFRVVSADEPFPFTTPTFDLMLAHMVFEHLPGSPRPLLNLLAGCVKEGGLLMITVPNAANLRKRLALLRGRTNYPPFVHFYWHEGPWRGHVREYVRSDLEQLARFAGFDVVELGTYHCLAGSVSPRLRSIWRAATALIPSGADSWYLVARKPKGWTPRNAIDRDDPTAQRLATIRH